ncbi:hypothetical protein FCV25MIE_04840 [Fagus crenata]
MEDRYRIQSDELRKAMSLANRYAIAKKLANGADEKICQADQKRKEVEESLKMALDSNLASEEKIKALEVQLVEMEKSSFASSRKGAEMDIVGQLIGIYNQSFHEGWKTIMLAPLS